MLSDYNFNLNPYYDDFDDKKNYHRILFKPGFAVQARELTQLQTKLQDQISKFGDHIFREGSVVLGGNFYSSSVSYIKVSRDNAITNFDNQTFTGQTSGAIGKVVRVDATTDEIATVYFSYVNGKTFQKNEVIVCDNINTETIINDDNYTGTATSFSIDEGVFYIYGCFVYCEPQIIIISNDEPATCRVGLFAEETITNSNADTSLLDPALGSYNYSAPGADRYTITLTLTSFEFDPQIDSAEENASDNFIELSRFVNGVLTKINRVPIYADIEDTLARRTYDESGDYTVRAFTIKVEDHIYGNTDLLSLQVEPGKAYVKGYEFETVAPTYIDLPRSRTTNFENEFPLYVNYGKYFLVQNLSKDLLDYTANPVLTLRDSTNLSTANVIGNCRAKYIEYDSTNFANNIYKLYIDDVNIFDSANIGTSDIISFNTSTFQANIAANSYTSGAEILGDDNPSYIIEIPKDYIASINSSETSYTTLIRLPDETFSSNGINAVATIINSSTKQRFLGSGLLNNSDTRDLFHVVVTTSTNTTNIPIGTVLDPVLDGLKITVVDENTLSVSTGKSNTFTATIFAKVGVSDATVRSKTLTNGTVVISGDSLTVANLSSQISLSKSDCIELSSVVAYSNTGVAYDYTNHYNFNNGQTDIMYDHGYITLRPGYADPITDNVANLISGNVTVSFTYYTHSEITGSTFGFFNVDSYSNYDTVPSFTSSTGKTYDLRDCFDFRPRRTDGSTTVSGGLVAEPSSIITTDFEHYLGRIDKLVLTKERKLTLIQGIPSVTPAVPVDIPDSMGLYIITVPPYTQNKEDVSYTFIENKRYTMRDIGRIEKRIESLEYYTALSLLEKQASDESIPSDVPTIDRFKNGILVDSFAGHSVGDVSNPDYACSIDFVSKTLRPRFKSDSYTFKFNSGTNYNKSGDLITLNYTTETFVNQPLASRTVNLNPYLVFLWNGFVDLNPPSDTWVDTTVRPDVIVNLNGENDVYTILADNVNNPASVGVRYGDWQTVSKGVPQVTNQQSTSTVVNQTGFTETTTSTTLNTQTTTVSDQLARVGLQISTGAVRTITRDLGTKIVDTSIAPFIRSRIVDFSARALKPSTELFAQFDGTDVTSYCVPATEIILASANTVSNTADSITLYSGNTAVSGTIIARRKDRIFVKEKSSVSVNSSIRFSANDAIYWVTNNTINPTPVYINTVVRNPSLITNENGDIAGSFVIPNNNNLRFRTGEKIFKLTDAIDQSGISTAASSKYVAQGLSQSTERTIVATRVATTSVNPVLDTQTKSSTSVSTTVVGTNTTVRDLTPPPPPPPPPPPLIPCGFNENGGRQGTFDYTIEFGSNTGIAGISYDAMSTIPDRFTLIWDGNEYTSGFVGGTRYNSELNRLGFPSVVGDRTGTLTFNKNKTFPTTALLRVDAPIRGTGWKYSVICPAGTITPPAPITTGNIALTLSHTNSVGFGFAQRNNNTLSTALNLNVTTTGSSAQFIRVSNIQVVSVTDGNGTSLPTSTVTLSASTRDFETSVNSGIRRGSGTVNVTINKPSRNGGRYTVRFSAIARSFNSSADRTSGTNVVLTSSTAFTQTLVTRDDNLGRSSDPVAQTFFVDADQYPNGIFLDSIDLYFKTKSSSLPATVELRPTVNGYPSATDIIPFSVVNLLPEDINISNDASVATNFKFSAPVYLPPGEFSFVARCNTDEYQIYTAVLGDFLLTDPNIRITDQPAVGSMFKSQNTSTWTPVQEEDVMFKLNKCVFDTTVTGDVTMHTDFPATGDVYFDTLFADGEQLDFAATNINYFYKTTDFNTQTTDSNWTQYQLGSNINMTERKIIRSGTGSDLQFRTVLSTQDRNITPVVDLSRLSSVLIQNIINNAELSPFNFVITNYGTGYSSNANVTISGTTINQTTGEVIPVSNTADAFAEYDANTGKINIVVTDPGSGYLGPITATITGGGATANASVVVENEVDGVFGGNALARYITRKVTLAPNFESLDLKTYLLANLPTSTSIRVYCKVAPITSVNFEAEPWREMILESSGTPSQTGFVEYKYKTVGDSAIPNGDRFKTFAIKIVMLSSNPTRVPQIRDLRVIALDD
jgi:hypothetical protein